MRKHLYLVTEHEDESRVGGIEFMDQQMSRPEKNLEGPIHVLDEDKEDFSTVGKRVGMGYADFDSEEDYEERAADVIQEKLKQIDTEWLEKADVDLEVVA